MQTNSVQNFYTNVLHKQSKAPKQSASVFANMLVTNTPAEQTSKENSAVSDVNPSEIYESMTMKTAPDNRGTGIAWTDEKLAALAGLKYGATVDTTKTINWQSTGDHTLTADEISELKAKYDVENLDPQSYYDLMSDLTNMNVLSAKDIEGMHLKKMDLGPSNFKITPDYVQGSFRDESFSMGNILSKLSNELEYAARNKAWSMSDEFLEMNPSFAKDGELNQYQSSWDEKTTYYQKLEDIFKSIQK